MFEDICHLIHKWRFTLFRFIMKFNIVQICRKLLCCYFYWIIRFSYFHSWLCHICGFAYAGKFSCLTSPIFDPLVHLYILSTFHFKTFGPSEVRATSGQHLGGHYFAYINLFLLLLLLSLSLFLLPPLFKTTEGVVVGFQIFAWAPKKK